MVDQVVCEFALFLSSLVLQHDEDTGTFEELSQSYLMKSWMVMMRAIPNRYSLPFQEMLKCLTESWHLIDRANSPPQELGRNRSSIRSVLQEKALSYMPRSCCVVLSYNGQLHLTHLSGEGGLSLSFLMFFSTSARCLLLPSRATPRSLCQTRSSSSWKSLGFVTGPRFQGVLGRPTKFRYFICAPTYNIHNIHK